MPKKYDRCVKAVKLKMKRKTYVKGGERLKSNPYAICKASLSKRGKK